MMDLLEHYPIVSQRASACILCTQTHTRTYTHTHTHTHELAYLMVEHRKSHKLLPASWKTRKISGMIQSKSKGPRSWSANR
jgi:hypothetical protein